MLQVTIYYLLFSYLVILISILSYLAYLNLKLFEFNYKIIYVEYIMVETMNEMSNHTTTSGGGRRRRKQSRKMKKSRKSNNALKEWVRFVKKVRAEEKIDSYKKAMSRAKVRADKGEKWRSMKGGDEMEDEEQQKMMGGDEDEEMYGGDEEEEMMGGDEEEELEGGYFIGGRRRRRSRSRGRSRRKSRGRSRRRRTRRH